MTYLDEAQMGSPFLPSPAIQFIVPPEMLQICVICMNPVFSTVFGSELRLPLFVCGDYP